MGETSTDQSPNRTQWPTAFTFAMGLVALEALKGFRESTWQGTDRWGFLGAAAAVLFYTVVLYLSGAIIGALAARILQRQGCASLQQICTVLAGVALWCALRNFLETLTLKYDAAIGGYACLLVLSAMATGTQRTDFHKPICVALSTFVFVLAYQCVSIELPNVYTPMGVDDALITGIRIAACAAVGVTLAYLVLSYFRARKSTTVFLLFSTILFYGMSVEFVNNVSEIYDLSLRLDDTTKTEKSPKNIILLVVDTLRADFLEPYGGQLITPAMTTMANEGVLIKRAYSTAPWTLPSMTSLFASQYPPGLDPAIGLDEAEQEIWRYRLPEAASVLAEEYTVDDEHRTAGLIANPVVPGIPGMTRGLQHRADVHHLLPLRKPCFRLLPITHEWISRLSSYRFEGFQDTTRLLKQHLYYAIPPTPEFGATKGFFLYLHLMDPHSPYDPPQTYRTREGPWPAWWPYPSDIRTGCPLLIEGLDLSDDEKSYVQSLYESEIRYVDDFIGGLMQTLERTGLKDSTILCLTSDHGEAFWDHGDWGHGQSLYEEQLHVPLLFYGAGIGKGTIDVPVSHLDLMPTVAALAGLDVPEDWRGVSYANAVRNPDEIQPPPMPLFAQGNRLRTGTEPLQAVIDEHRKLIRGLKTGVLELYDLSMDPGETRNLATEQPEVVARLSGLLDTWQTSFDPILRPLEDAAIEDQTRKERLDTLRDVGYLE